jgi:multidrug efflux pump subunit AcrA (membrane-fusion protein)
MSMETEESTGGPTAEPAAPAPLEHPSGARVWVGRAARVVLVAAVLAAGAGISYYWLTHRPATKRRPPEAQATLVEVLRVAPQTETVVLRALGTVVPARTVQLAPRVAGEIVQVSPEFVPGGRFQAGDVIVQVDPKDFELAVRQAETEAEKRAAEVAQREGDVAQRQTDVVRAESALAVEMGQQSVAKREYELLGQTVQAEDEALVLRRPQLETARAACEAARAATRSAEGAWRAAKAAQEAADVALQQARLDLDRTTIRAPFGAIVQSRFADRGSQVSPGAPLATLVGTDAYWVQASLPVDQLRWIKVPDSGGTQGSAARVYHEAAWGPGVYRAGRVVRRLTSLEPQGRMAQLLVAVEDPLHLETASPDRRPLILEAYVRVEIEGRRLENILCVPRTALRDGNRVWVMRPDGTLDIRPVTIVWGGNEHVCIADGLAGGDRVVTSDLGAPVQGMALRAAQEPSRAAAPRPPERLAETLKTGRAPEGSP